MRSAERLANRVGIRPPFIADEFAKLKFSKRAGSAGARRTMEKGMTGEELVRWTFPDGSEIVFGPGGTWVLEGKVAERVKIGRRRDGTRFVRVDGRIVGSVVGASFHDRGFDGWEARLDPVPPVQRVTRPIVHAETLKKLVAEIERELELNGIA